MKLFTILAGYAAGLAIAMKYRKDKGTSKLESLNPLKTSIDTLVDEIVDIHKNAFTSVKDVVSENFDDIDNFADLQKKISGMVSNFSGTLDKHIEKAKKEGIIKKDELLEIAQEFYAKQEANLEVAKRRAKSFSDTSETAIELWLADARKELKSAYKAIQSEFDDDKNS